MYVVVWTILGKEALVVTRPLLLAPTLHRLTCGFSAHALLGMFKFDFLYYGLSIL